MAGIGWNRLKMTDWMPMAGAVSALVVVVLLVVLLLGAVQVFSVALSEICPPPH